MSRTEVNGLRIVLACVVLFAALFARSCWSPVYAQTNDADVLVLAQSMVAESNWTAAADRAAIAHVLRRRATQRGISLARMCGLYVSLLRKRGAEYVVNTPRALWVRGLTLDAAKPDAWPASQSWAASAPRWRAVIADSRAFLAGNLADPCPGSDHWGGNMDHAWKGLVVVTCADHTLNTFYRVTR
jgi:hypothetical protein